MHFTRRVNDTVDAGPNAVLPFRREGYLRFAAALQRMVPAVRAEDLVISQAGVRAPAVLPDGSLVEDFLVREFSGMLHVLNAPSPAATTSLSIGRQLARRAIQQKGNCSPGTGS